MEVLIRENFLAFLKLIKHFVSIAIFQEAQDIFCNKKGVINS